MWFAAPARKGITSFRPHRDKDTNETTWMDGLEEAFPSLNEAPENRATYQKDSSHGNFLS